MRRVHKILRRSAFLRCSCSSVIRLFCSSPAELLWCPYRQDPFDSVLRLAFSLPLSCLDPQCPLYLLQKLGQDAEESVARREGKGNAALHSKKEATVSDAEMAERRAS